MDQAIQKYPSKMSEYDRLRQKSTNIMSPRLGVWDFGSALLRSVIELKNNYESGKATDYEKQKIMNYVTSIVKEVDNIAQTLKCKGKMKLSRIKRDQLKYSEQAIKTAANDIIISIGQLDETSDDYGEKFVDLTKKIDTFIKETEDHPC